MLPTYRLVVGTPGRSYASRGQETGAARGRVEEARSNMHESLYLDDVIADMEKSAQKSRKRRKPPG